MSQFQKTYQSQTSRMGLAIYPVRIIGYLLACASVLSSQYFFHQSTCMDTPLIVFLICMAIYPHIAFQVYRLLGKKRSIEFRILTFDMFMIGWISSMLYFSPVTAMPFVVTNSATNYSVNGMKLFLQGIVAHILGCVIFGFMTDFQFETDYEIQMAIPSLIYLFLGVHYVGIIAFHRGAKYLKSREALANQNKIIAENNQAMISSINYAKRIQTAILPFDDRISEYFGQKNYFIIYRPKDIVAGDFYWIESPKRSLIISIVADCTGHGVPGAFMSLIGTKILDEVVMQSHIYEPDEILQSLHSEIQRILKQSHNENQDGMDAIVLTFDLETRQTFYAGAMIPLYFIPNEKPDDFQVVKASNRPLGGGKYAELYAQRSFEKHTLPFYGTFYLTTDGFQDQFGGKSNKKFNRKKFRSLLKSVSSLPMNQQKIEIENTLDNWMQTARAKQTDDITVIGIRI